jgi:hypothetical protein
MAYAPVTILDGNSASKSMGAFQDANSVNYPSMTLDTQIPTYRAGALFTPTATAAVTVITVQGSATKTVRITRIGVSYVATDEAGCILSLQRASALGAGGTQVSPTVAELDTSTAAATAVVSHWTSTAKAAGTGVGGPISTQIVCGQLVALTAHVHSVQMATLFPENSWGGQAIVLRGTSDYLEINNLLPTNLSAGTQLAYFVEWREDAS